MIEQVLNVFEAVDVITVIKGAVYEDLNLSVGEALLKRASVSRKYRLWTIDLTVV